MRIARWFALGLIGALATTAAPVTAADPIPPFIPADAHWLTTVNYYRAMAGLGPVTENASFSSGAYNHSCYMLYNGITHDEIPGRAGYTASGDTAGNNGNIAVSSVFGTSARSHIELWMTGPFHAIGILRHNLSTVGFGKCDNNSTSPWRSGATLDVLRGLGSSPRPSTPILWPGNGTTTNLTSFITEFPNPLDYCYTGGVKWTGAGLPVIAMMPEAPTSVSASMTGPNGAVQVCALHGGNTTSDARAILQGDNAVTVLPRNPLTPGTYTVTVNTQARSVTWSFTVDPTAATGVMPIPTVTPLTAPAGIESVAPFRFIDTRLPAPLRLTKLTANIPRKIKVAGVAGLPTDTLAISANLTALESDGAGYITLYNCSTVAPTTSSINFQPAEVVANAGVFPLNSAGELCIVSNRNTGLLLDINGVVRASGSGRFDGQAAVRALDTTTGFNVAGRLQDAETVELDIRGGFGVPTDATTVALNLTTLNPSSNGYITVWPCGPNRPVVSNINFRTGASRTNNAIVPLSADGSVCVYTHRATDLRIDVVGFFDSAGNGQIVPASPTRFTDTRDVYRAAMNLGTGGNRLVAGQTVTIDIAGERGVPSTARSVSVNITVTGATAAGSITVYPCGPRPSTATLVYVANQATPNGAQARLDAQGQLCVYTTASAHLIVDVVGWWT